MSSTYASLVKKTFVINVEICLMAIYFVWSVKILSLHQYVFTYLLYGTESFSRS